MQTEIEQIINEHLFPRTPRLAYQQNAPPGKVKAVAEAIAELFKSQIANQTLLVIFDELHDALEDVQLCDNTASEAEAAWKEIASIVERFKSEAIAALSVDRAKARNK